MLFSFFADFKGNSLERFFAFFIGALFWAGLIGGALLVFFLNRERKRKTNLPKNRKKRRIGAFCFLSNKKALVADAAMVLFFILTLTLGFIPYVGNVLAMVMLSCFLFAVYMHCMLNGVNYQYIQSVKKEQKI